LDSGYIKFVDGLVCGDDFASGDDFMNIFFPGFSGESKTRVPTSETSVPTSAATLVPGNGSSNIFSHDDGLVTDDGDQNIPAGNNQAANATTPTNAAITSAPTPSTIAPTNGPITADASMIKSGCTFRHHSCYHWLFHLGVTLVPLIFFFQ
jgi:hypothetical protein